MDVKKMSETLHRLMSVISTQPRLSTVNAAASVGQDGILLVDTAWAQTGEPIAQAVRNLSDGVVKLIIITHPHLDHYGGSEAFQQATLIAHKDARGELLGEYFALTSHIRPELPIVMLEDKLSLRFNGEEIQLIRIPGHTSSDVVVYFPESGVACVGDLIFSDRYPGVDMRLGGDVDAYVEAIEKLTHLFPAEVKLITGHGRDYTMDDLNKHYRMAFGTTTVIREAIRAGKNAQDMIAENILKDWETWNDPQVTTEAWIRQAYQSLSGQAQKPISEPLTYTIVEKGVKAAIEQYDELKNTQPDAFDFGENQLNILGYHLLWRGMIGEAIDIFKLNVQAYPQSANPYDSLGEAYMASGDQELARKSYAQALELNPAMPSAIQALEKLGA